MLCEPLGQAKIGQVIDLTEDDHVWGDQALVRGADGCGRARRLDAADVERLAGARHRELQDALEVPALADAGAEERAPPLPPPERVPSGAAASFGGGSVAGGRSPAGGDAGKDAAAPPEDVRMLRIDVDPRGDRFKAWRDVAR